MRRYYREIFNDYWKKKRGREWGKKGTNQPNWVNLSVRIEK